MRFQRFDQTCPHCEITEALGGYCTNCFRPTEESWKHPPKRSPAQVAHTSELVGPKHPRKPKVALGPTPARFRASGRRKSPLGAS